MYQAITNYFSELSQGVGRAWNEFWFTPRDTFPLSALRIMVGLLGLCFLISHSTDLVRWFGPSGLLPMEAVIQAEDAIDGTTTPMMRFSFFQLLPTPGGLWLIHVAGIVVLAAMTVGFYSRITTIASLVIVLSYVHRGPIITAQFEPVLTMMLFYLCLAPTGRYLSLDAYLKKRKSKEGLIGNQDTNEGETISANVAIRLMQVHVCLLYITMCLSKLAEPDWWNGQAIWWLIATPDSGIINLQWLESWTYFLFFWTHLVPLFEGFFALLVWNRMLRPLLLGWAVCMWLSLAMITGLITFALMMLVVNLVFVSPEVFRAASDWCCNKIGLTNSAASNKEPAAQTVASQGAR